MSFIQNARRSDTPGTFLLIGLLIVSFLMAWLFHGSYVENILVDSSSLSEPWRLFFYIFGFPGDGYGFICLLLMCWWLFFIGGTLERDLGTGKMLGIFFGFGALAGLFFTLGLQLIPAGRSILLGPYLAEAAMTVIWGFRYPKQTIMIYGIIPIQGLWIAILSIAIVVLGYGTGAPLLGAFAALHLAVAWAFARDLIPFLPYAKAAPIQHSRMAKATEKRDPRYYEDVKKREKEREERERLRKLFESSLGDEPKDR